MDDLIKEEIRFSIFCEYILNSQTISKKLIDMAKSEEKLQKDRSIKIFEILNEKISEVKNDQELMNTLIYKDETFKTKIEKCETIIKNNKDITNRLKSELKVIEMTINENIEMDDLLIKSNLFNPIHSGDLLFLNKIAGISIKTIDEAKEQERIYSYQTTKDKVYNLYHTVPYYFEQAFSNTDLKVQKLILKTIEEKYKLDKEITNEKTEALENLRDLYTLSDIDNLTLKMNNIISYNQAVNVFENLLIKGTNENLITKVMSDDIIMKAMFKIKDDNKEVGKSVQAFKKFFVSAKYPYNENIINKFKEQMKLEDKDIKNIANELSKDMNFDIAYKKYETAATTKRLKNHIETFFNEIEEMTDERKKAEMLNLFNIIGFKEKLNQDVISDNALYNYSSKLKTSIFTTGLYKDNDIMKKFNQYQIKKISEDQKNKNIIYHSNPSIIFGMDPYDIWLDTNIIFAKTNFNEKEKIYLKYNDNFSYEFKPYEKLKFSEKELHIKAIRELVNEECIVCSDIDYRSFELYITSLYQRIYKAALKDKITVQRKEIKKTAFKTIETQGLSQKEEKDLRRIIYEYAALNYLIDKDQEFFKEIYTKKARLIYRDIENLILDYEIIVNNVQINSDTNYLNIFRNKGNVRRMLTELDDIDILKKDDVIKNNLHDFKKLSENNKTLKKAD